ncbi:phage tail protein [Dyella subtropica]|uniref:phage tail protein n=1 Tax=Dyella subtropica TaxID=2992127 RepID=UPI00224D0C06|nr:tail fiber protein [Dyella subtropica]
MASIFLGQIMLTPFGFAPKGMARCDGATLAISQNQALFSLLGTTYGGNGTTNFVLPDLRGRTPLGFGDANVLGEVAGVESVTLISSEIPLHTHQANASTDAGSARNPTSGLYGKSGTESIYGSSGGAQVVLNPATLDGGGQNQPHTNMQPYLVLNFCIALNGIYPSRN